MGLGVDEQQIKLRGETGTRLVRNLSHAQDRALGLSDHRSTVRARLRVDPQRWPTCLHERFVVAPHRLGAKTKRIEGGVFARFGRTQLHVDHHRDNNDKSRGVRLTILTALTASGALCACSPPTPPKTNKFTQITREADRRAGLLTMYVNAKRGKVWLEIPDADSPGAVGTYLYVEGLATGLGSNPVGLDRGQLGGSKVVALRRQGGRLLIEEQNLAYRALSDDPQEQRATRESFATSVLWAGLIEARAPDGRGLVDITSFIIRDAHGIRGRLRRTKQGDYKLDADRSAVDLSNVLAFADNVVFEALLTFSGDKAGDEVSATAPVGDTFSIALRQSFVRLPDDGYTPRRFDPRSGSFAIEFDDYAASLNQPIRTRWLVRHRLKPGDTLTYYVDRGIPEPIRSAVVEGAKWWSQAFEAAGFPNAFQVELLPPDAHPLDVRYNVIQWVHRATRGWSYGSGVIDPRTGEMLKGHVSLGSLRVRQDRLIFEGLAGTASTGTGRPDDPIQLALARIRQLSAHEVGHTLGFAHNFAASTYGRASVMDYPAPLARVKDGAIDLSQAYDIGIGEWDIISTRYAYTVFAPNREAAGLAAILEEARSKNMLFLSDADARPAGAAHPLANLWDNGTEPIGAFEEALAVRKLAIERFGLRNLPPEQPLALLEEVFAPLYFYHRYQLDALVKPVGGLLYGYPMRDDPDASVRPVDAETQRNALQTLLQALQPDVLDIPDSVLLRLVPRAHGVERNRELFSSRTAPGFDPLGAARTAADLVVASLLRRERAARLVDQHRRDPALPSLTEVVNALIDATFAASISTSPRGRQVQQEVRAVVVARLMALAVDQAAPWSVRAEADRAVSGLVSRIPGAGAFATYLRNTIRRFVDRNADRLDTIPVPAIPPGSPIGSAPDIHRGCGFDSHSAR